MCFPCNEDEYVRETLEQIRETLADAVHPLINVELSLMPRVRPNKMIQLQSMYDIFIEIEVPKYMQRSPWLEPLSLQSLGARRMPPEIGFLPIVPMTAIMHICALSLILGNLV